MPRYHFKLVDSHIVSDHGVHELVDDAAAQVEPRSWRDRCAQYVPNLLVKTAAFRSPMNMVSVFAPLR
jgi:hypothetical protein